jgi:hypothetical protein
MNTKNKAALRARLRRAQENIYGNGRVRMFPKNEPRGAIEFFDWLGSYAERSIDYISGERMGLTARETTGLAFPRHPYESKYAVLIRDGIGKVYCYGRMGKTFYPADYAGADGCGFHLRDLSELNAENMTRTIQLLEQFNAYIRECAQYAAECYDSETSDQLEENAQVLRNSIAAARACYSKLHQELRVLRGIDAPQACEVLRQRLQSLADSVRNSAQELRLIRESVA